MLEKDIEKKLVRYVREHGGLTYKFVSPGNDGVPDRIIIYKGAVWFAELKTEAGRLAPRQTHQLIRLQAAGCNTAVVYGWEDTLQLLEGIFRGV